MATEKRSEPHPQSAPGDFYVVNHECTSCGAPHVVAPDLIGWNNAEMGHCIWKKQPETPEELDQAVAAFDACCLGCYRYAGEEPEIAARIGLDHCDQTFRGTKSQSNRVGVLMDNHPMPVPFTWSANQSTSLFFRLIRAVASLFKRR